MARKLAVIMHAMWCDGTAYCGDQAVSATDAAAHAKRKDRRLLGALA
ncbi:transposase (fragment) [Bradyrhizobium sp. ORS 375]